MGVATSTIGKTTYLGAGHWSSCIRHNAALVNHISRGVARQGAVNSRLSLLLQAP